MGTDKITVNGLTFEPYLKKEHIAEQVERVAQEINRDHGDDKPLFVCVLTGAFVFAADCLLQATRSR